jgi:hypothetical protein
MDDRVDCIGLLLELSRGVSGSGSLTGRACMLRERNGDNNFLSLPACSLAVVLLSMPRILRGQVAGQAYHVLNRENGSTIIFCACRTVKHEYCQKGTIQVPKIWGLELFS